MDRTEKIKRVAKQNAVSRISNIEFIRETLNAQYERIIT